MTVLRRLLCRWFGTSCPIDGPLNVHVLRTELRQKARRAEAEGIAFRYMRQGHGDFAHRLLLGDDNGAR